VHYGAGFLFVFKARQQAHSELCNCCCNVEDGQKDKPECTSYKIPIPKYEVDKYSGALTVDRFMGTAMQYPSNYGYIPQSLSEDGDPVDVMVITPAPLLSGCVVKCRPIGVLQMTDEAGADPKERGFNNIRKFDAGFWFHRGTRKTGA
jgi:inorganic pyrophosphatase